MQNVQSPRTDDAGLEPEIAAVSAAPRVTMDDIVANIEAEHYFTAADAVLFNAGGPVVVPEPPLSLLTFCVLVLKNGFTVSGESACASPENFNAHIGRRIARENAVQKMWPLMGYVLKDRLWREADKERWLKNERHFQARIGAE